MAGLRERGVRAPRPLQHCCRFSELACEPPQNLQAEGACCLRCCAAGYRRSLRQQRLGAEAGWARWQAPLSQGALPNRGLPTATPVTSYSARQLAVQYELASDPAYVAVQPLSYMLQRLEEWACAELRRHQPASHSEVKATTWAGHHDCILLPASWMRGQSPCMHAPPGGCRLCSTARHGPAPSGSCRLAGRTAPQGATLPPGPGFLPRQAFAATS